MLNLPPQTGAIIISVPILILSYIISQELMKQISLLGGILTNLVKDLAIKIGTEILGGSLFFTPVTVIYLTSGFLGLAWLLAIDQ